ncbi:sensor histidine kinase [Ekhidna sp. To15]|uniref:sensor histidine kinase n=1 Tax=Ekhidna sp. To15 TaxID=3395267 RepID=UPI003F52604A
MKRRTFLWHSLFWVVYMSIFTFVEGGYSNKFRQAFFIETAYFPIRLVVVYLNYFVIMPGFLLKGRIGQYLTRTFISILIAAVFHRFVMYQYINELIFPDWDQGSFWQLYKFVQAGMIITSPMIFLIGITVVYRLIDSQKKLAQIAEERTKAELLYLKNQINPHFFFNTLNNLYGLALSKSDKTPEVVMKLSELMSYMLYDTKQSFVTLDKEIHYIKNYIELEEVRFEGRFNCNMKIEGMTEQLSVPPLLLLPFVENAFKHGVNTSSSGAWINVNLVVTKTELSFSVENSIGLKQKSHKGGLGIKNVQRRLELLYPDKHELTFGENDNSYKVFLALQL